MRRRFGLVVFLLVVALPQHAAAEGSADLAEGLRLFDELDYDAAAVKLTAARRADDLGPSDRAHASLLLSIVLLAQGEDTAARDGLREALRLEPTLTLPGDSSPKLEVVFEQVKANLSKSPGLRFALVPQAPDAERRRVAVRVDGDGARAVATLEIYVRRRAASEWQSLTTTFDRATDTFGATLPDWAQSADVECFLEARGGDGALLTDGVSVVISATSSWSGPNSPNASSGREESSPWRWWVWAGAGAAVVATVVASVLVATHDQDTCRAPAGSACVHVIFR